MPNKEQASYAYPGKNEEIIREWEHPNLEDKRGRMLRDEPDKVRIIVISPDSEGTWGKDWFTNITAQGYVSCRDEWIENYGYRQALRHLLEENNQLRTALHDAIRRPLGVVPESAEPFYDESEADRAEERRLKHG